MDPQGRLLAVVCFDLDERRAAAREMVDRLARIRPGRETMTELVHAILDHDLERLRAAISADFAFHDHRHSGAGRLDGADGWIAWMASLFAESPDSISEPLYVLDTAAHGTLYVAHSFGTLAGGGAFETVMVQLWRYRDGRPVGLEIFERAHIERAWARFAELGEGAQ